MTHEMREDLLELIDDCKYALTQPAVQLAVCFLSAQFGALVGIIIAA